MCADFKIVNVYMDYIRKFTLTCITNRIKGDEELISIGKEVITTLCPNVNSGLTKPPFS